MPSEISSVAPVAQAALPARSQAPVASAVLTLLQPVEDLLPAGQSATAQVIDLKQNPDLSFQVVLKLTSGGLASTLAATSSVPLAPGTSVTVTQPSAGTLAIAVQQIASDNVKVLTSIDTSAVPEGSLLQGKVISSLPLPDNGGFRNLVSLVNSALTGSILTIDSPRPLAISSLLSAQVLGDQTLRFVPMSGRIDQLVVGQQLQGQQNRQASLDTLIIALQNIAPPDGNNTVPDSIAIPDTGDVGAQLRASVTTLLAGLPDIRQMGDAKTVAQALNDSGVFLEAKLLGGQNPALTPDLKANLLRLVATLLPQLPASSFTASSDANAMAQALPFVRSALGILGQVGKRAEMADFPLPPRSVQGGEQAGDLEHLLRMAAGAIARLQSHQLAGLDQTRTHADGTQQTTWQLEVPMRNLNDIVPLQVRLQREEIVREDRPSKGRGRGRNARDESDLKELLWKLDLAFDIEPLGPLQIQAQLLRGNLSSHLWAEQPDTARLIQKELGTLRERLVAQGLSVEDLVCHLGVPPQGAATKIEQRWVDENA